MSSKEMLTNHSKFFFFFNDTATTEIYTLSLHDALPISITAIATWPFISCSTWRKNCLVCRWKIFSKKIFTDPWAHTPQVIYRCENFPRTKLLQLKKIRYSAKVYSLAMCTIKARPCMGELQDTLGCSVRPMTLPN